MKKRAISTDAAPAAVGPYSQGIYADGLLFTSGQIPATPAGELITDDIEEATRQSLKNIQAVLEEAGASMADVVKATIFLTDMNDFAKVNAVYEGFFPVPPPARSCIQVAALPKGVPIEIEAIALI